MGSPAKKIEAASGACRPRRPTLHGIRGELSPRRAAHRRRVTVRVVEHDVMWLALALALLQILDGILTGIGMVAFGTSMEGNVLLRSLMLAIGPIPALLVVKGASLGIICFLCLQAPRVPWLRHALRLVVALYLVFAVIPWSYFLLAELMA